VVEPRGFETGYTALVGRSTRVRRGDVEIRVGGIVDLIRSKGLLRRAKDVEHLAVLYEQFPELAPGAANRASEPPVTAVAFRILPGHPPGPGRWSRTGGAGGV